MVNIFWVISLVATTISVVILMIYALPFNCKQLEKITKWFVKIKKPLYIFIVIYALALYNEFQFIGSQRQKNLSVDKNTRNYLQIQDFRTKRNFYILLCGIASSIGVYLVLWQSESWSKKNQKLRERLNLVSSGTETNCM